MSDSCQSVDDNASVLGRLLHELSYAGKTIRQYRGGGRGYENILTAEVLQGLDFLPRRAFMGAVLSSARGADAARAQMISEIEDARFRLLPGSQYLAGSGDDHDGKLGVQPDGLIESPSAFLVLEAKSKRSSSFQPEQLAREYVLALRDSGQRTPLLLLVLASGPPVKVEDHGKLSLSEAISLYLERVLDRAKGHSITTKEALSRVEEVVCWITWQEISVTVELQREALQCPDPSVAATIERLAGSVIRAIAWHGH